MEQKGSLIKSVIEIIPLILFFVANAKYGIILATKVFVVTTIIALVVSYMYYKKVSTLLLITSFLLGLLPLRLPFLNSLIKARLSLSRSLQFKDI